MYVMHMAEVKGILILFTIVCVFGSCFTLLTLKHKLFNIQCIHQGYVQLYRGKVHCAVGHGT